MFQKARETLHFAIFAIVFVAIEIRNALIFSAGQLHLQSRHCLSFRLTSSFVRSPFKRFHLDYL
jgi:hypothetical protein